MDLLLLADQLLVKKFSYNEKYGTVLGMAKNRHLLSRKMANIDFLPSRG